LPGPIGPPGQFGPIGAPGKQAGCPLNIGKKSTCGKALPLAGCYCFVFKAKSWQDAQAHCSRYDMQLVGLQTKLKEHILTKYMISGGCDKQAFWTSGSMVQGQAGSSPSFQWLIDGSAFGSYSNWCYNEPNVAGSKAYVLTYSGCWHSARPESQQYYICEQVDCSAEDSQEVVPDRTFLQRP
jgi:hypothetical protein